MLMNSDFEPPPKKLSWLATVGGIVTAIIAIASLRYVSEQWKTTSSAVTTNNSSIAQLDAQSAVLPGTPVTDAQMAMAANIPVAATSLSDREMAMAKSAWTYFENNWNEKTGLVNAADGFASVTLWDQATAIAALISAKELGIIPEQEFKEKLGQTLKTLATMPLYRGELPNKVYNAKTAIPVNYGAKLEERAEIGWSAIDLGRLALWLKIVENKYPQFQKPVQAVWKHWKRDRLVKNGQMYGTSVIDGKEQLNQEGRLGYENYAAFGFKLWGLKVDKALDSRSQVAFVNLYGQGVPYDNRDYSTSGANNYVVSEPYILDGIETGFQSLPKAYSDRVLAAQEARYQATKILTAVTEDNLDRDPRFVYNTLFVNGQPWATITDIRERRDDLRFLSTKAAIGWHVLYNTDYTQQLFSFVEKNLNSPSGWYSGFYESLKQPNQVLTANNNGAILESLLYKKVGKPLTDWAGVSSEK